MPRRGGKRTKTRTHVVEDPNAPKEKIPQSFVFKRGDVDPTIAELVEDTRKFMLPNTASKLKEKKSNTLQDFADVAGPLGVTHFVMFSQSEKHVSMRLARVPRGPTLQFRVVKFSRARDVIASQKNPADMQKAYIHSPLVVLNGFQSAIKTLESGDSSEALAIRRAASSIKAPVDSSSGNAGDYFAGSASMREVTSSENAVDSKSLINALKTTQTVLQNMFPSINVSKVKLSECRRVVLFHYDQEQGVVEFRHYSIRAIPAGLSKGVKKLMQTRLPDLGGLDDVSEYVTSTGAGALATGAMSDSEYESEGNEVTLPQEYKGRGNEKSQTSAIRLSEVGPRFTLQLLKIEQGMCNGEILYHAIERKSQEEVERLRKEHERAKALKAARKAEQARNVAEKQARKQNETGAEDKDAANGNAQPTVHTQSKQTYKRTREETKSSNNKTTKKAKRVKK
eukprot:gb/GECG01007141.1/.p1 GENE.gb/GECG01007141.1/~~gb/GECG01007141.1/.p1  ORF type:complete len:453 (+),score=81.54 gb/GECG01007141.1/:1-1359(+)